MKFNEMLGIRNCHGERLSVLFCKLGKWSAMKQHESFPNDYDRLEYFLCLPKFEQIVLDVFNGVKITKEIDTINDEGMRFICYVYPSIWNSNDWYMNDEYSLVEPTPAPVPVPHPHAKLIKAWSDSPNDFAIYRYDDINKKWNPSTVITVIKNKNDVVFAMTHVKHIAAFEAWLDGSSVTVTHFCEPDIQIHEPIGGWEEGTNIPVAFRNPELKIEVKPMAPRFIYMNKQSGEVVKDFDDLVVTASGDYLVYELKE